LSAGLEPISTYFSLMDTQINYGNSETLRQQKQLEEGASQNVVFSQQLPM